YTDPGGALLPAQTRHPLARRRGVREWAAAGPACANGSVGDPALPREPGALPRRLPDGSRPARGAIRGRDGTAARAVPGGYGDARRALRRGGAGAGGARRLPADPLP